MRKTAIQDELGRIMLPSSRLFLFLLQSWGSLLPLDHFTHGQVNFEMSFGPPYGDIRQLRYMNLETGNPVTIWNLEYGITAQVIFKTLDLN